MRRLKTVRRPPIYPKTPGISPVAPSPTPFRCPHAVHPCPSVDSGETLEAWPEGGGGCASGLYLGVKKCSEG